MRKKARYRVGQVVYLKRPIAFKGRYARLLARAAGAWWEVRCDAFEFPLNEERFRPLTAREKGKD